MKLYIVKDCALCEAARKLLAELGFDYEEVDTGSVNEVFESKYVPVLVYFDVVGPDITTRRILQGSEVVAYLEKRLKNRGEK